MTREKELYSKDHLKNDNLYVAIKAFDTKPDSIVYRLTRCDEQDGDLFLSRAITSQTLVLVSAMGMLATITFSIQDE